MIEVASLSSLRPGLERLARRLLEVVEDALGVRITITSVTRSRSRQVKIWERCMRGASPFPAAFPGTSPHELGIAFDLKIDPPGRMVRGPDGRVIGQHYLVLGQLWERLGLRWGGRFRDEIHFDFYPKGHVPAGHPRSCRP